MTDKDLKTISEKIDSLHEKILKSKFAEIVTESEVMSLILAIQFLNSQQAEIDDLTERLNATTAGQETLQKALAEKDREVERLTAEKEQLIKTFGECQEEAIREFSKAVIDGNDEGYISHSSDIVDFTADYLRGKGDTE